MFGWKDSKFYKARIATLEDKAQALESERFTLKSEVEDLKIQRKVEDENLRHLTKMKDEKREIEFQKKEIESQRRRDEEIARVKDSYRDKVEKSLHDRLGEMQKMYTELMARLPNVNAALTGKLK